MQLFNEEDSFEEQGMRFKRQKERRVIRRIFLLCIIGIVIIAIYLYTAVVSFV